MTGFRRGTDVWWYAECEPDRTTAFRRYATGAANKLWGQQFRDVIAEVEAPGGGLIWYDEVFHTDAPAPEGPWERGFFSLVIDPRQAEHYDELHAEPWPEMLEAIAAAGLSRLHRLPPRCPRGLLRAATTPTSRRSSTGSTRPTVAARWGEAFKDTITTFTDEDGLNFTAVGDLPPGLARPRWHSPDRHAR